MFETQQGKGPQRRPCTLPTQVGAHIFPSTPSTSSRCPCALQEEALPGLEPATPFKQQRSCLTDVKLIRHPQKQTMKQNASAQIFASRQRHSPP